MLPTLQRIALKTTLMLYVHHLFGLQNTCFLRGVSAKILQALLVFPTYTQYIAASQSSLPNNNT